MHPLILSFDLVGTFVFALSGATLGVRHRLDLFGVLVLSFAAGSAGGIIRDVLMNLVPAALVDWRYLAAACLAGLVTFFRSCDIERLRNPVQWFDAGGLALFAALGANKAMVHGMDVGPSILLGMLTGVGGGVLRDLLVAQVPVILRAEFYAIAALFGAATVVVGMRLGWPPGVAMGIGALLCFSLRALAILRGWRLPVAQQRGHSPGPDERRDGGGGAGGGGGTDGPPPGR
ncbi:MAG: trimeric intracellular cation channel family protein [Xanthomonadales bacterium]|nr:trimeric intracellular cation channel family protein [Xanthomonadales bacterium]